MKHKSGGFTLIELMVAVVVIAILSAIAIPQYNDYITRSRITTATAALADAAVRMEQFFQDNRVYTGACVLGRALPADTEFFTFGCPVVPDATTFTVQATGRRAMAGFDYQITQAGKRTQGVPSGWSAPSPNTCWVTKRGGEC